MLSNALSSNKLNYLITINERVGKGSREYVHKEPNSSGSTTHARPSQ